MNNLNAHSLKKNLLSATIIISLSFFSSYAFAVSDVWDGSQDTGSWADVLNWATGTGPVPGTGDTATFNSAGGATDTISLDVGGGVIINSIVFSTSSAAAYTIGSGGVGAQTLTVNNGGSITVNNGVTSTQTINSKLAMTGNYTITNNGANDGALLNCAGNINTSSAGTLTLNGSDTGDNTISSVLADGAGVLSVTKSGTGKWIISNYNTYTGTTTVSGGTLYTMSANHANGAVGYSDVVVENGGTIDCSAVSGADHDHSFLGWGASAKTVTINEGGLITDSLGHTNAMRALIMDGGTLSETGATSVYGNWGLLYGVSTPGTGKTSYITGGNVSLQAAGGVTFTIGAGDTLEVSAILAHTLADDTGVIKQGSGTLSLSGANTYESNTTISAGTVRVSNASALGTGNVDNDATLDVGTTGLSIGGTYTQGSGSQLNVTVASVNSAGSVTSTGTSSVSQSSSVYVTVPSNIFLPNNTTYTIVSGAAGGTMNVPDNISTNGSYMGLTGSISGNDLIVKVNRSGTNGFSASATNQDSSNVANVFNTIETPSQDMSTVLTTVQNLSSGEVANALNTLYPSPDTGVMNNSVSSFNNFVNVSTQRVENVLVYAKDANNSVTGISAGDAPKNSSVWAKGYGSYLSQGKYGGIQGYDAWNMGTAIGVDRSFPAMFSKIINGDIMLGISGGYAYGDVNSKLNNGKTYINSAQTTIYTGYADADIPYFLNASGSFGWNWYNGTRDITIGSSMTRTANASYDGQEYGAYFGGGYIFHINKYLDLTPLGSLRYNHLRLSSYTETEADSLNLSVGSQSYNILQSGAGCKLSSVLKYDWGTMIPELYGKWLYDFIGDKFQTSSAFSGGGASFATNGCKPAQSSFNIGAKLEFASKKDITLVGEYSTEIKEAFLGQYGSVTVKYSF